MIRLGDWTLLVLHRVSSMVQSPTDDRHLRTDPTCVEYRAVPPMTRLDRASRGVSCTRCLADRAWGRLPLKHFIDRAGPVPDDRCTGASSCAAPTHVHGCFADLR